MYKRQVVFGSVDERDAVFSYAANLTAGASMDVVIPDNLKTEAMRLEHFAYKYRQKAKESAQGDTNLEARTQIRLDSMREGLLLGIRDKKEAPWTFFQPKELPDMDDTESEDSEDSEDEYGEGEEEEEEGIPVV